MRSAVPKSEKKCSEKKCKANRADSDQSHFSLPNLSLALRRRITLHFLLST